MVADQPRWIRPRSMSSPENRRHGLCEPGVCRIFFSSPFNGMEGEREELTRRYWPQIASLCNSKGLQFVPVDMRWGITSELSDDAQTINICLREIDRSDMFIGFFGQRYGWHGENDEALQKNFEMAIEQYQWLEEYRDRSVTELEFLHGHLRHPGVIPSCICFRDKAWDDKHRQVGVDTGNKRTIYKYSPESEVAVQLMDDLKARVKDTENKCLAVHMTYPEPEEGARLMFEAIWKYLTEVLLKDSTSKSKEETERQDHDTYSATRTGVFVGGEQYLSHLNQYISQANPKPLLLQGVSGVGKTAILSKWINNLQEADPDCFLVYHFVGVTSQSREITNILGRIISTLKHQLKPDEPLPNYSDMEIKSLVKHWMEVMNELSNKGQRVKIILDGLDKINHGLKVSKAFYWLPEDLPSNIYLICATRSDDEVTREELIDNRQWSILSIDPLDLETREQMCKAVLILRGKVLSEGQTDKIVAAEQTQNPLFLKILLEELCNFGRFRELDKKIDWFTSSQTPEELFEKFLERCEADYNTDDEHGNIVAKNLVCKDQWGRAPSQKCLPNVDLYDILQVMCALCVSRHGLSQAELQAMFNIPTNIWTPLYYGINKFTVNRGGFISLAHTELGDAVRNKYIKDENSLKDIITTQIDYFHQEFQTYRQNDEVIPGHFLTELPWLCHQGKHNTKLLSMLQLPGIFHAVLLDDKYELLEYVQTLDLSTEQFISSFTMSIRLYAVGQYNKAQEDFESTPKVTELMMDALNNLIVFLSFAHYHKIGEHFLLWNKQLIENNPNLDEQEKIDILMPLVYDLGKLYTELKEWNKALEYHKQRLDFYLSLPERDDRTWTQLGLSYHGTGLALMGLSEFHENKLAIKQTDEKVLEIYNMAAENYRNSIHAHQQADYPDKWEKISKSLSCLAEILAKQGNDLEAIEQYERVLKLEETIYYGQLPIEMSYTMVNLGICYRKMKQFDKALDMYERSMKIKRKALGWYHTDVALGCGNFARYYGELKEHKRQQDYLKQAIDIYEHLGEADTMPAVMQMENLCLSAVQEGSLEKMREFEPYFWQVFEFLLSHGELDKCLPFVHHEYMKMFMSDRAIIKLRKLVEAYVKIPKLHSSYLFCYINYIDHLYPPEGSAPKRPYEETIDYAIEKYPGAIDVVHSKLEFELIPAKDMESVKKLMKNLCTKIGFSTERPIVDTSAMFPIFNWPEAEIELLTYGLELYPNSAPIYRTLAKAYYRQQKYKESFKCLEEGHRIDPTDMVSSLFLVSMALMVENSLSKGKAYLEDLKQRFGEEEKTKEAIPRMQARIDEMEAAEKNNSSEKEGKED